MAAPSTSFDLLDERVKRWVWRQGWTGFREIQERAIPAILPGTKDVLLASTTASGKTEAAFLPLLSRAVQREASGFRILYVGPLRALINDQFRRLEPLVELLDLPVHRWHGDVSDARKKAALRHPSGVLLMTPESLEALFIRQGSAVASAFRGLEAIVLDEVHAYIGSERGAQLQSLLHRLELVTGRRLQRVGLSATLGEPTLACAFLRPGAEASVELVEAGSGGDVGLLVRGFVRRASERGEADDRGDGFAAEAAVADWLADTLREGKNLVFANSRQRVEFYADALRRLGEQQHRQDLFFAHHGNLSRELREQVEKALKEDALPVHVVCTTTLELGIDIGDVKSIAQVGCPPSVASLRQRLGRSGRRTGRAELRCAAIENELQATSDLSDSLRVQLFQLVAMIELLLARWCEPPDLSGTHWSTLIQQVLSIIAERGGVQAAQLYRMLCADGPFRSVSSEDFVTLLRNLGQHALIEQASDGTLLPGKTGERLLDHFSFYAAFQTTEELRIEAGGRPLGTLSTMQPVAPGGLLVFAGRRWLIEAVDVEAKVVRVVPAAGGRPPLFEALGNALVHDEVRRKMRALYEGTTTPRYLDDQAVRLFKSGRETFARLGLADRTYLASGDGTWLFHWSGDRVANTLDFLFRAEGYRVEQGAVAIRVEGANEAELRRALLKAAEEGLPHAAELLQSVMFIQREKWDQYVPTELLVREFGARMTDIDSTRRLAQKLVGSQA